jgi:excinuclease ABC subunit C
MTPELEDKIARLPTKAGVYIMRGHKNEILYIGKATNLRSRVRSYFNGHDPRPFVRFLSDLLGDLEVVIAANPKEALLLENTLIKKHRPRFNFMLRDDKNYLSLRLDLQHPWPRVELVRQIRDDGARYFGPYHSAQSVRQTLNVLNRYFQLRTCPDTVLNNRTRPCLQHQINRCPAPCVLPLSREGYMDDVEHAMLFLQGKQGELSERLTRQMHQVAAMLEFERAAHLRDQIAAIAASLTHQSAVQTTIADQDVIGLHRQGETVVVAVMLFRQGSMVDVSHYVLTDQLFPDEEVLSSFIAQYYHLTNISPPEYVYVPAEPEEKPTLEELLTELRGTKVQIHRPQRGEKLNLLDLATQNAQHHFEESVSTQARNATALAKLQQRLRLRELPRTMECYDISNFQGKQIVASGVAFLNGEPDRAHYRRYRIRTTAGQDDFQSMFEVLTRRARAAMDGIMPMPDLLIIDGGKGQLGMAIQALSDLGLHEQEIISLAKSRVVGTDDSDAPTSSAERVFVPGHKEPVVLRQNSDELHILTRIRDEAHRVAITYHRELRKKETIRSRLDDIPGVGPSRRSALLRHFGSVKSLREATLAELEKAPGISRALAASVFSWFHPDQIDSPSPTDDDVVVEAVPVDDVDQSEPAEPEDGLPAPDPAKAFKPRIPNAAARELSERLGTTRVIAAGSKRPGTRRRQG